MRNETPNERNYRLLRERFMYHDRIVYDDGKDQYTLEMLMEMKPVVRTKEYYCHKFLYGDEAILFMLKQENNRVRNEISDVIMDLEMKLWEEHYRPLTREEIREREEAFENVIEHGNELTGWNENENENENKYNIHYECDLRNKPLTIKIIDMNGNETEHRIEKITSNGNETTLHFENENENGNGNEPITTKIKNKIKKLL
jgi:hypothetical protein